MCLMWKVPREKMSTAIDSLVVLAQYSRYAYIAGAGSGNATDQVLPGLAAQDVLAFRAVTLLHCPADETKRVRQAVT